MRFFALEENFTNAVFVQVTMTVDDLRVDRWRTEGSFSVLASSRASVGGSSEPYRMPGGGGAGERNNFVGCMKKVRVSLTFFRVYDKTFSPRSSSRPTACTCRCCAWRARAAGS